MTYAIPNAPLAVVRLTGGLGNQMFQYAFGEALSLRNKIRVKYDTSEMLRKKEHNGLELPQVFGLTLDLATLEEIKQIPLFFQKRTDFNPEYASNSKSAFYCGWWNTEKYFDDFFDNIRSKFQWKNTESVSTLAMELSSNRSVAVHLRRGDFLTGKHPMTVLGQDYYIRAILLMEKLLPNSVFYIFTDDHDSSNDFFTSLARSLPANICLRLIPKKDKTNSYLDMYLMTKCRAVITANSSFSWWGAKLNQFRDVPIVAPLNWYSSAVMKSNDVYINGSHVL